MIDQRGEMQIWLKLLIINYFSSFKELSFDFYHYSFSKVEPIQQVIV
jgi:hypothetical protein